MHAIKATVQGGRLELQVPPDWPDGIEVEIYPLGRSAPVADEGPMTPDEIARILAAMEQVEPFAFTDAERAALQADRAARREWEKAHFDEHADKLRRSWE